MHTENKDKKSRIHAIQELKSDHKCVKTEEHTKKTKGIIIAIFSRTSTTLSK